jgi:hypothetical protein
MTFGDIIETIFGWAVRQPWDSEDSAAIAGHLCDRYRDPRTWGQA